EASSQEYAKRAPRFLAEPSCFGGLSFVRYYGHGAGGFGNETGHGVTGMRSPLLLIASMQFFSISWPGRLGFPASTSWFPDPVILWHAAPIRPLTVMCEHRSNALPSTFPL